MSSVLSSEQFRGKGLRDPGHGRFRATCAIEREKTKEMLKAGVVEIVGGYAFQELFASCCDKSAATLGMFGVIVSSSYESIT